MLVQRHLIADLAADPDAARWARECGWVAGTGHCRHRACAANCVLRPRREAEHRRMLRWRQLRRLFIRRR
jgi:hypothetical protein